MSEITPDAIAATATRIAPYIRVTPTLRANVPGVREPVSFKLEFLQHTGSFKARGAFSSLVDQTLPLVGIAAASGGNHGAAVAFAARQFGIKAKIFVPRTAPKSKVDRIVSYGADIVQVGETYQKTSAHCLAYCEETGAQNIHAYDQVAVLLGQGTVGLEFETQSPETETLLVATGGGGLIGGIAAWYQGRVNVVSVEPTGCATLHTALQTGKHTPISPQSIAQDSLGSSLVGTLMLPMAQKYIKSAVLVSDAAIIDAMKWLWTELRIAVEPGGATALAALISGVYVPDAGERFGILLCGANIDAQKFGQLIA